MDAKTIIAYFCGELSDEEEFAVEVEIMGSPALLEQALQAEEDLVQAFADGSMPLLLRERFQKGYPVTLTRREKLVNATNMVAGLVELEGVC
jgi:hypothetical protein